MRRVWSGLVSAWVIVGIAAFNLLIDFAVIEKQRRQPRFAQGHGEWDRGMACAGDLGVALPGIAPSAGQAARSELRGVAEGQADPSSRRRIKEQPG